MAEKRTYVIDGVEYQSLNQIPAEHRALFDMFENTDNAASETTPGSPENNSKQNYVINGVTYASLSEVPAEHRAFIQEFEKVANSGQPGIGKALRMLFSAIPNQKRAETSANESSQNTRSKETGFFGSSLFKMMIATLVIALIVYIALNYNKDNNQAPTAPDSSESFQESPQDEASTPDAPSSERFSLLIEDPNEPPYQMFVGLYEDKKLLLRINLPDGALDESGPEGVIRINAPTTDETTLVNKQFSFEWQSVWNLDEGWEETTIGNNTFSTFSEDDYGAGQHYVTRYYAYPYGKGALIITVLHQLRNADASEPAVPEFDMQADVTAIEQLLMTLKQFEQSP